MHLSGLGGELVILAGRRLSNGGNDRNSQNQTAKRECRHIEFNAGSEKFVHFRFCDLLKWFNSASITSYFKAPNHKLRPEQLPWCCSHRARSPCSHLAVASQ